MLKNEDPNEEPNASEAFANNLIAQRFRGYYPVIVDVETGGLDATTDALLELAVVTTSCTKEGYLVPSESKHFHIVPFEKARILEESLKINKIMPFHPFRFAVSEREALTNIFHFLQAKQKDARCSRCVLVGHNSWFDLGFINAAIKRTKIKKNPFHAFTSFDTATLSGLVYGHTVLAQALKLANIPFNLEESHSALYDAQKTAELFCNIVNKWPWKFTSDM